MRIAYLVHQYLPDHIGGTEIYTHGLAKRARNAGYDVLVLTYSESPSPNETDFRPRLRAYEGVPIVEFPYNLSVAPSIAKYEYDNPFIGEQVRLVLAEWAPDVAHMTHGMKLTVAALDACRSLDIPVLLTLCDFWFLCPRTTLLTWDERLCGGPHEWRECLRCEQDLHGIKDRRGERLAIRERRSRMRDAVAGADRVFALSPFLKGMFVANGYEADRIEVLPHGLETADLETTAKRHHEGRTRLIFIGSLVRHKGAHVVIEALRGLPDLDVELRIFGALRRGDEYVESLIRASRDDPRIVFAGTFPQADLGRILVEADYLVAPALWFENEPLVVKAAQHLGLPVIASDIGSLADMVDEGVDGRSVQPGDVKAWREAIRRAVNERTEWARAPRPQPNMDQHFMHLAAVYEEVVSSGAAVGR